jgi:polyvinyl alcohol dehydrogenase (cytochrome)
MLRSSFGLALFVVLSGALASNAGAASPNTLYRKHCATCHDSTQESPVPGRLALELMSPERILEAMSGRMASQAKDIGEADRRKLAEYLSKRPVGKDETFPARSICPRTSAWDPFSGPTWNGWGAGNANQRFQSFQDAGLSADDLPKLKLKWAFGFPGEVSMSSQPTVVGGRLFVGTRAGFLYALDAGKGCMYWRSRVGSGIRTAPLVGKSSGGRVAVFVATLGGEVHSLDPLTGERIWMTNVRDHPHVTLTGTPKLHDGKLYVPVSSAEEPQGGVPGYECCTFRGSLVALDAGNGKQLWRTYMISKKPEPTHKSPKGTQFWGPSGVAVWSSPVVDPKLGSIYVTSGNLYTLPFVKTSDSFLSIDLASGGIRWSLQKDTRFAHNGGCAKLGPDSSANEEFNCVLKYSAGDEFNGAPMLIELAGGKRLLIGTSHQHVTAVDPDQEGKLVWKTGGKDFSHRLGWSPAFDGKAIYVAVERYIAPGLRQTKGGVAAVDPSDGRVIWFREVPCPKGRPCHQGHSAPVTALRGAVLAGGLDGHLRAFRSSDGEVLWDFDTDRRFKTLNGVSAHGGAIDSAGPVVVGGTVYVVSGYMQNARNIPGNILLAFSRFSVPTN